MHQFRMISCLLLLLSFSMSVAVKADHLQPDVAGLEGNSSISAGRPDIQTNNNGLAILVQPEQNFFGDAINKSLWLIFSLDKDVFLVAWTSIKISCMAVLIASIFALPLGIIVGLKPFAGRRYLLSLLNTLMAMPTVIVGLLLYGLLNRQGILGGLVILYTPTAIIIGQTLLIMPIIWNLSISAVSGADPRLQITCLSLGANLMQQALIYAGEVRFALMAAIVTGFGRAIGEVGIAMMLGGNIEGFTRTMTTAIALETSKGEFEFALALGMILLLVALLANIFLQQFQEIKQ